MVCKETTYLTPRAIVENGQNFSWDIPADGYVHQTKGTFAFISRKAFKELKEKCSLVYYGITWRKVAE